MKLRKSLNINIKKAYTEGIYTDNSLNRKLGRVGMKYGINVDSFEEKEDKKEENTFSMDPKTILRQAKSILSERGSEFIEDIVEGGNFDLGSLYTSDGKIHLNMPVEIDPVTNSDYINLGKRTEERVKESSNEYYKFLEETYNREKLTKRLSINYKEEGKSYTNYSILDNLAYKHEQMNYLLDDAKRTIYINGLEKKNKYYKEVIKHNMEMLIDMQKIVNLLRNKY